MERTMTIGLTPRFVIGLTVLWIGTFWLAHELGVRNAATLGNLWPIGIIVLAVAILLNGGSWVSALFVGGAGVWLLGRSLDLFDLQLRTLWPLILVFFGVHMILKGAGLRLGSVSSRTDRTSSIAIFGNRNHTISGTFSNANVTAILGSSTIDLTRAKFSDGARIESFCLAGGVHVIVSPDTRVVSDVVPIMAGYEDKRRTHAVPTQTLNIAGLCFWGGVEVSSASPETEGE